MPTTTSEHRVIMTQRGRLERLREGLQLPGLAEALEVYDRIAQRRDGEEPSARVPAGTQRNNLPPTPVLS